MGIITLLQFILLLLTKFSKNLVTTVTKFYLEIHIYYYRSKKLKRMYSLFFSQ